MKALVLCGGMPQAYLARELKKRGFEVLIADRNEKAPAVKEADAFFPVSTLDVDGIRSLARDEKVDMVLSVCADQMLLVAAQVSEELGLPCYIDYETAKKVSNKAYMKEIFVKNGIPTSKHVVRARFTPEDIEGMSFPLIVKPVDCYSSRGVKRVENVEELEKAFVEAVCLSRTKTAIIEEFAQGDELSVDYYVENGEAKLLCARVLDKVPNQNGFVICRGRYPAPLSAQGEAQVRRVGQQIADAFGLKDTPMLVQMKLNGDQVSVIEFCARTGGGIKYRLLPKVCGFDVVNAVVELTLGKKPHYDGWHSTDYILDEFLYAQNGVLDHYEGFEALAEEGVIEHWETYRQQGHEFTGVTCSGDRAAYFSVRANSMEELREKQRIASSRVRALNVQGEDLLRHDIVRFIEY